MEKTMRQPSDTFAVAALLALAGGFLDAYTYLCRGGVFANAQTGNMVLLALRAAEGRWQEAAAYLAPILAFALGVLVTEGMRTRYRGQGRFHWRHWVLGVEILEPGCKKIRVCPHLDGLDWAKGSYPTPFGVIKLEHKRLPDGSIRTAVQAPPEIELVYENAGTGIS